MTSKTSFMKYFLIAFTLMFISSGLNAGTFGSDGKKKDKEKKKSYRLTGRMCFISLMVKRVSSVLIRKENYRHDLCCTTRRFYSACGRS